MWATGRMPAHAPGRQVGCGRVGAAPGRRALLAMLGAAASILGPRATTAQPRGAHAGAYRIGTLSQREAVDENSAQGALIARALARLGHQVRRDYVLIARNSDLGATPLPQLVAELVAAGVDLIITFGYPPAVAAKEGTDRPVVCFAAGDPVGTGLAASLERPGGHVTGISDVSAEITPKRLQLLKDLVPGLRRVAILWNAGDPAMTLRYQAAEAAARSMGVSMKPLGVREPNEFGSAFAAMRDDRPDAILMVTDALTNLNRRAVFDFAAEQRLPAMFEVDRYVRDGGLMSYGPDVEESLERVAVLTDRIMKGARAGELPFEQPTRFRFAVNLRTARALGLVIPQLLLAQADDVVE